MTLVLSVGFLCNEGSLGSELMRAIEWSSLTWMGSLKVSLGRGMSKICQYGQ